MNFRLSLNLVQSVFCQESLLSGSQVSMLTPTWSVWRQHWVHTYIGSQKQSNTLNNMLFPNSGWKHIHKRMHDFPKVIQLGRDTDQQRYRHCPKQPGCLTTTSDNSSGIPLPRCCSDWPSTGISDMHIIDGIIKYE